MTLSVPAFLALTTALWVASLLVIVAACVAAWHARLPSALALSALAAVVFNAPVFGVIANVVKLQAERKDQLFETAVGTAVTAMGLVFAMTGVLPFVTLFVASAILCLLTYGASRAFS